MIRPMGLNNPNVEQLLIPIMITLFTTVLAFIPPFLYTCSPFVILLGYKTVNIEILTYKYSDFLL